MLDWLKPTQWMQRNSATADNTRDLLVRDLNVRAQTLNEEERSVEVILATRSRVTVFDMMRGEIIEEELDPDGVDLMGARQLPLLESHNRYSLHGVLGSIRNIRTEGEQVIGRAYFAQNIERAEEAWQMVRQGHLTAISAGYRSAEYDDIDPGESRTINGRSYTAGRMRLRITHRWQPREGSLVVIGADPSAHVRGEHNHSPHPHGDKAMPPKLRNYLMSLGLRSDATDQQAWAYFDGLNGNQRVNAEMVRQGIDISSQRQDNGDDDDDDNSRADDDDDDDDNSRADDDDDADGQRSASDSLTERARVEAILRSAGNDVPRSLVNRAITEGWDTTRAAQEFLTHVRSSRPRPAGSGGAPAGHTRRDDAAHATRALAAAVAERAGIDPVQAVSFSLTSGRRGVDPERARQIAERSANDISRYPVHHLMDVCRTALMMEGRDVPHDREEMVRAATSTAALGSIFTTSVNAVLLQTYQEEPDTTGGWVVERDVNNFMQQERHALEKGGQLQKLPRGDTAQHDSRAANLETYKIARYARQFVIDEQDIIDDLMNALVQIPEEMGLAARRLRPDLVYSILLGNPSMRDGTALFHNNHGNNGTLALSKENLEIVTAKMWNQQENGVNLNVDPTHLIVNPDLSFTARELVRATQILVAGDADRTVANANALADLNLEVRQDGRLKNGVTDPDTGTTHAGSGTGWFVAGARTRRTIEVGYLAGTGRVPQVRRFVLDRGQWGIGFDVKLDIGAKALDWRALQRGNS